MKSINSWFNKPILTFDEACKFTGLSKSTLYKHTHLKKIPFYKPNNRKVYFKRIELEDWLLRNRSAANYEIEREAIKLKLG